MLFSILAVTAGTALAGQVGYLAVLTGAAACAVAMALLSLRYRHDPDGLQAVGLGLAPDLSPSFSANRTD